MTDLHITCLARGCLVVAVCLSSSALGRTDDPRRADLNEAQVKDIVRRSYQYVAMYNVIQKLAYSANRPVEARGFNKPYARTTLVDHTAKNIARPNNDTLYGLNFLDLRADAIVLELPAVNSKYASLEVAGYDHYCDMILSTRMGDFAKPSRVLFYTARTKEYDGAKVPGVDRAVKLTCDFTAAGVRVMPHQSEPARFAEIVKQMKAIKILTLAEYQRQPARPVMDVKFPVMGKTDADVFGTNLLEVMQFVFNHTTFDPKDELDQGVLAVYKRLGIEPGKMYAPDKVARIDYAHFRKVAEQVAAETLARRPEDKNEVPPPGKQFRPKGTMNLDGLVHQSVAGPMGLPPEEARYLGVNTADGKPMNAMYDYVIRLSKDELPPANAFWSFTVYDTKSGFLIPNDRKKYSVGHNAGMKLNTDGGIEIHVAAKKPDGVPDENWLPINRGDEAIDVLVRIYVPDIEKMRTWKRPRAVRLPSL